jgi:non-specific serine/threonine protein kinase
MALSAETGDQWASSTATWVRGATRWLSGDPDGGIADALASLAVKDSLGDIHTTTMGIDLVAVCLTTRGGPGDLTRAATLYGASDAQWEILGLSLMVGQFYTEMCRGMAHRCREALGAKQYDTAWSHGRALSLPEAIALARSDKTPPAVPDPKPLTRREREIAALVATGMGNREIAEQLFLSRRTIESHVEHIFGKLGCSSRSQITDWVRIQQPAAEQSPPLTEAGARR